MLNVFYAKRNDFSSSLELLKKILNDHFSIFEYSIFKNENGKPFLKISSYPKQLFFSVSHTSCAYFIAICNENVGIDAEPVSRTPNYSPILQKFPQTEREEILSVADFLKHWTVKESTIKWLGGSIANDLKKLGYIDKKLTLDGLDLPIYVKQIELFGHFICITKEKAETPLFQQI
jgi:phosphopantetheinyl transferase